MKKEKKRKKCDGEEGGDVRRRNVFGLVYDVTTSIVSRGRGMRQSNSEDVYWFCQKNISFIRLFFSFSFKYLLIVSLKSAIRYYLKLSVCLLQKTQGEQDEKKIDNFPATSGSLTINFFLETFPPLRQQLSIPIIVVMMMMMIWVWRFNQPFFFLFSVRQKFPLLIAQPRHFPLFPFLSIFHG